MFLGTDTEKNTSRRPTNRQIGHVNDFHTDILSKRSREDVDTLIQNGGVYKEAYEKMVGEVLGLLTNTITVTMKVKRGQNPQQVLDGTGRIQYTNYTVVGTMPLQGGDGEEEVEFVFFKVGRSLPDSEVEAERKKRGLFQDLAAQAQYNADNPDFATDHPNGDSWKTAKGKWCFAYFNRSRSGREVSVRFSVNDWNDNFWFGGRNFLWLNSCLHYGAGASFMSCFCQPPSILPTSSSLVTKSLKVLVSILFNSQATCNKNFNMSSLILAF